MNCIDTMRQALEALELHATQYPHMQKGYTVDAITALRLAIEQASESMSDKQLDPNTVEFRLSDPNKEVLRLDKDGFHYKGQTIDDAGEAYRLFMDWMGKTNMEIDNELP